MLTKTLLVLAVPFAVAACSRPVKGAQPYDDSAAGHRAEAAEHQADADKTLAYTGSKAYYDSVHRDHKVAAKAHLRAAQKLEAEYAEACEDRAPDTLTAWPDVASTDEVDGGVVLHLTPSMGDEEEVLTHLRCHRAALALEGFDRFPDDPLALAELDIVVHDEPGGTAVMLGVDSGDVGELRRRVQAVEQAD
ncbi:MAG: hypothetical protein K8M05_03705 [Deltaproteobacteria bacterium]|nr:hypothetical protein [Kofleriaceae bacterium]